MDISLLFGRMHPLVLHFPIALILLAAAVEAVRLKWDRPAFAQLVPFLLKGVADATDPTALFQPDRIHPKAQAHPIILSNVWPVLKRML